MMDLHHEQHGDEELWLVSYADLVTILMGFFVIMYSLSNQDAKKVEQFGEQISSTIGKADLGSSPLIATPDQRKTLRMEDAYRRMMRIAGLGGEPEQIIAQLKKIQASEQARREMAERFQDVQFGADTKSITPAQDQFISPADSVSSFVLPERLLFKPGTDALSGEAIQEVRKLAKLLANTASIRIEVLGHTDSSPPGANAAFKSNWALSSARAGAIAEQLILGGVSAQMIAVRGMADTQPIVSGKSAAQQAANRRVEIKILQRH